MAKILIVDDEPAIIQLMTDWLALRRHEPLAATSGVEAVRLLRERQPDLILLDADMPGMSGVETCRRLRAEPGGAALPIILTGGPDPASARVAALFAGATDCAVRPLVLDELGAQISRLLGEGRIAAPQGRMIHEALQSIPAALGCQVAWLFAANPARQTLSGLALAAADGSYRAAPDPQAGETVRPEVSGVLAAALAGSAAEFNLSAVNLGSPQVALTCQPFGADYFAALPLMAGAQAAHLLVLASRGPLDLAAPHIRQALGDAVNHLLAALAGGADQRPTPAAVAEQPALHTSLASPALEPTAYADLPEELIAQVGTAASADDALRLILNDAARALSASLAMLAMRPPAGGDDLVIRAAVGLRARRIEGVHVSVGRSVAGQVLRSAAPQRVADAYRDERFDATLDALREIRTESVLAVPVMVDGQAVAVLEAANRRDGLFTEDDQAVLEQLARLAADLIARERTAVPAASETAALSDMARLREISALVTLGGSPDVLLTRIAGQLLAGLHAGWCLVARKQEGRDALVGLAQAADLHWPLAAARRVDVTQWPQTAQAIQSGSPLAVSLGDAGLEPGRRAEMSGSGIGSLLLLPLIMDGQVVGLAELGHHAADHLFSSADIDRAGQTARQWREQVGAEWHAPASARRLGGALLAATGVDWFTLRVFDPQAGALATVHALSRVGWAAEQAPRWELDETSLRRAALGGGTAIAVRLNDNRLSPADRSALRGMEDGAALLCPLVVRGATIGLIQIVDPDPAREFGESDLLLAGTVANLIGGALENARLYTALEARARQLESAYGDLREADRVRQETIQNVSHELRTPLTAIIGYSDLMLDGGLGPLTDEQREGMETIAGKVQIIHKLAEDILSVQQITSQPLSQRMTSLVEAARMAAESIRPRAEQAHITLIESFADGLPDVYIDSRQMFVVFEHLLDNAVKFSSEGSQITLSLWDSGPAIQVEVTDQGIGIAPEEHDKVWRRFYQVDGTTTRQHGGTGVGLALVRQIVEQHGGRVWLESAPGKGSTFGFTVPKPEFTGVGEFVPSFEE